jgi:hypothetical protein
MSSSWWSLLLFIFQILRTLSLERVSLMPENTCKWWVSHHGFDKCIYGCWVVFVTMGTYHIPLLLLGRSKHYRHIPRHRLAWGEPISVYLFCLSFPTSERPLLPLHQSEHEDSSCRNVCSETPANPHEPLRPSIYSDASMMLFLKVVGVSQGRIFFSCRRQVSQMLRACTLV